MATKNWIVDDLSYKINIKINLLVSLPFFYHDLKQIYIYGTVIPIAFYVKHQLNIEKKNYHQLNLRLSLTIPILLLSTFAVVVASAVSRVVHVHSIGEYC